MKKKGEKTTMFLREKHTKSYRQIIEDYKALSKRLVEQNNRLVAQNKRLVELLDEKKEKEK